MKILLVLVAVYVLWWLLRRSVGGRDRGPPPVPPTPPVIAPQPMEVCAQCGVHLPRDEALPGRGGLFCGEPHRAAFERSHPER